MKQREVELRLCCCRQTSDKNGHVLWESFEQFELSNLCECLVMLNYTQHTLETFQRETQEVLY